MYTELIYTIYKLKQEGKEPTKETLITLGIPEEKIIGALDCKIIYENKPSIYTLAPVKELYQYGLENLEKGNKKTAHETFELCYMIKPKHRETCLQLMYHAVNTGNYNLAYDYLTALENVSTNEHLRKDYKIYLYLLSKVCEVPERYQTSLQEIKENKKLLIHSKPNAHQKQENYLMNLILKDKYKYAIEKINDYLSEDHEYTLHRVIIKSLLRGIINLNDDFKADLHDKVKQRNYSEIALMLETKSLNSNLGIDEQSILTITQQIISILETRIIPQSIENDSNQVAEAIKFYDYEKALLLEKNFLISKHKSFDTSSIYLLLDQITKLIYNINRIKESEMNIQKETTL